MEVNKKRTWNENRVWGWCFVAFSAFLLYVVYPNQIRVRSNELVSSDVFPKFCAIAMLVLGLLFLLDGYILNRRRQPAATAQAGAVLDGPEKRQAGLRVSPQWWAVLTCVIYIWSMQYLGFIISSLIFLLFTFWISGMGKWWLRLIIAAAVTAGFFLIFQTTMRIVLPKGVILPLIMSLFQ